MSDSQKHGEVVETPRETGESQSLQETQSKAEPSTQRNDDRREEGTARTKSGSRSGHRFGGRSEYRAGDRSGRRSGQRFGRPSADRGDRGGHRSHSKDWDQGEQREYRGRRDDRGEQEKNYVPRVRPPAVDESITQHDLPKESRQPLLALKKDKAEEVAKQLVQIFIHLQSDPTLALPHAEFLKQYAARIDVVREAVGLTYYANEDYAQALKEFRTYRRMTNSTEYLAHIIDCERGMGNVDKALQLYQEYSRLELPLHVELELALVVSGIRLDRKELDFALEPLRNPRFQNLPPELRPRHAEAIAAVFIADGQVERGNELLARFGLLDSNEEASGYASSIDTASVDAADGSGASTGGKAKDSSTLPALDERITIIESHD